MKHNKIAALLLGLWAPLIMAAPTGTEVMMWLDEAESSKDVTQDMVMLIKRNDIVLKRLLKSESIRTEDGRKSFMEFFLPAEVKGTRYLTWSYDDPKLSDDMWLYLPNANLTRRISGSASKGTFMRSDLINEDLQSRSVQDDAHTFQRMEPCGEVNCYVVESIPYDTTGSAYQKRVTWVLEDIHLVHKIERYSKQGHLLKTTWYGGHKKIGDYWMAQKMVTKSAINNSETLIQFKNIKVNVGLNDNDFDQSRL
ncbi:MAG: outer membrane lipoprotein-sorting protein [Aliivibrio sp.]|uniref:outer membrane lipoprotein-sorting protein n=1 Tax=Aliivibrio sp. TaxID=1872443 RepID=UPI001A63578B|nr:outer membrane lipoprotein-sorting protein [Aliivibrio sp.]